MNKQKNKPAGFEWLFFLLFQLEFQIFVILWQHPKTITHTYGRRVSASFFAHFNT